ncbi:MULTISPECIES: CPBP family intramembrane glutamic endopeptidase [Clostridium]|uniref:CPBP family intramembrane glutamic endopeptidase n=1 Tax=Clostridium TaxID=1485 RepID=UPI0008270A43|nr:MULTISPECIES: type II CAAX endopeptidase family protein [Clostridium]PJI09582.1 CPBP family intramembrane metalloprotease [Clostridium sp. CT7]
MNFEVFKNTKTRYLFIQMFVVTILSLIALVIFSKAYKITINDDLNELYALIVTLIWFLLAIRFIKKNEITIGNFVGKMPKKMFIVEVPIMYIISYLGAVGGILVILFGVNSLNPSVLKSVESNMTSPPSILSSNFFVAIAFLGTVVAAPIAEEFIFRGILMGRLYNKYGIIKSIIISSFIFFIMHLTVNPVILFLGFGLAILDYKYKSLIPSICLHALNNFITFMGNSDKVKGGSGLNGFDINNEALIFGIILLVLYMVYLCMNLRKCAGKKVSMEN